MSREVAPATRFDPPSFLWQFGAVVGIGTVAWIAGDGLSRHGNATVLAVAVSFAVVFGALAAILLRTGWRAPAGVLATVAVAAVPLLVYSLQNALGLWEPSAPDSFLAFHEQVHGTWVTMEITTIGAGLVALALVRAPLVLAPVCFVAWYFAMDLAPAVFGRDVTDDERAWTSIGIGLVLLAAGLVLDARGLRRHAFWPHVFGFLALLGAICWLTWEHNTVATWTIVTVVSLVALFAGLPLGRSTFVVFGSLGLLTTLCYWTQKAFWESTAFPFALALVALAFVGLGILWAARAEAWGASLRARLARERA